MESIADLFEQTLAGDYDDDAPWEAVWRLRKIGTREVFEHAEAWLHSPDPRRRARGADVLAMLGVSVGHPHAFPDQAYQCLTALLQGETDVLPLRSAIYALGHVGNPGAVAPISAFAGHQDDSVRYAVACALGHFPNDSVAIECLLKLMRDKDEDVRDWAIFGLGIQGDADSERIREAFVERLSDPFEDARLEAIAGLAKRQDPRVLKPLLKELEDERGAPMSAIEAAYLMLGMEQGPEGWDPDDYCAALRERYPNDC
jgi:HEAT repeat protein